MGDFEGLRVAFVGDGVSSFVGFGVRMIICVGFGVGFEGDREGRRVARDGLGVFSIVGFRVKGGLVGLGVDKVGDLVGLRVATCLVGLGVGFGVICVGLGVGFDGDFDGLRVALVGEGVFSFVGFRVNVGWDG